MSFETTRFSNLRENVSPELASLPDRHLAEALAARNIDAEAMEGFFNDLGRFASRAAPAILPVAGRIVGGIYGGPAGAAIGGQLGSLAGGAITSATGGGRRPAPPRLRPSAPRFAPTIAPIIATGVAPPVAPPTIAAPPPSTPPTGNGSDPLTPTEPIDPGAGSPAASQLLQTITRPETLAALASMAMGSSGRTDVPIGGTSVPVTAFSNLISVLAGQADAEYSESIARAESSLPAYMRGESGEARGDPAIEEHRAGALFEFLNEHESYGDSSDSGDSGDSGESEWSEWSEWENESSEYSESFESVESSESAADAAELVELAHELSESESE